MSTASVFGSVHSWDVSTGVDGPGTRFVVFLAGCPLRCQYCHNPDTWRMNAGTRMSVDQVIERLDRYARFIRVAGGGVTVSGGEPLMQSRFVGEVFRRCKELGLHTALDTSGFGGRLAPDDLLDHTDLVLLDIKSWTPRTYRLVTGVDVAPTLEFARRLSLRGNQIWVRFVLVPGLTDDESNVDGLARAVASLPAVQRVDVVPFHRLGQEKYARLGLRASLEGTEPPSALLLARVRDQFASYGLSVS